jgi:hypothetical protein
VTREAPSRRGLKNACLLTACLVASWAFVVSLAWLIFKANIQQEATIAAALCLIPGWLVFAFYSQYGTAAPLAVFLIATAGRMAAVLIGALAVKAVRPDLNMMAFALSLGAFYVLSLAIETKLLLKTPAERTSTDD